MERRYMAALEGVEDECDSGEPDPVPVPEESEIVSDVLSVVSELRADSGEDRTRKLEMLRSAYRVSGIARRHGCRLAKESLASGDRGPFEVGVLGMIVGFLGDDPRDCLLSVSDLFLAYRAHPVWGREELQTMIDRYLEWIEPSMDPGSRSWLQQVRNHEQSSCFRYEFARSNQAIRPRVKRRRWWPIRFRGTE